MTEAIAETDEGREGAKAAEARIKEFRAGGREVESEEPAVKQARGSDESMEAEVPDSSAGAAQEPMEDDAEDPMEKQKRVSGWEGGKTTMMRICCSKKHARTTSTRPGGPRST